MSTNLPEYLKIADVAKALDFSQSNIRYKVQKGIIPAIPKKNPKEHWRIPRAWLEEQLSGKPQAPTSEPPSGEAPPPPAKPYTQIGKGKPQRKEKVERDSWWWG